MRDQTGPGLGGIDRVDVTSDINVLAVDDDPDFADLTATFLERREAAFTVETAESAAEGLACLEEGDFDCVVSDHDMPDTNGLEFLEQVREDHPDLPFILFTGKGSEEIASEAISAGVTEYMQKEGGSDQYAVLANRIENAVEGARVEQAARQARHRFQLLVEEATDAIMVLDKEGTITYAAPSAEPILGRPPEAFEGMTAFDLVHPEDREVVMHHFGLLLARPDERQTAEFRYVPPDGDSMWVEARGRNLLDHDALEALVVYLRDVTDRKRREQAMAETSQRLSALVEASPLPIMALDPDGTVTLWNQAAEDCFGWSADVVVGEMNPIVPAEQTEEFDRLRERVLDGEAFTGVPITRQTADGESVELSLSVAPIRDGEGDVDGIMAVLAETEGQADGIQPDERLE